MLPIQTAELINRVRRFFGVAGDARVEVSAVASPTIALLDVSQAPYRQDGVRWWAHSTQPAVAANFGGIRINSAPLGTNLAAVIDTIILSNNNASNQTYSLNLDCNNNPLATINSEGNVFCSEYPNAQGAVALPAQLPHTIQQLTNAAFGTNSRVIANVNVPQFSSVIVQGLDIVVDGDVQLGVYTSVTNVAIAASFSGRLFQIRA